MPTVSCDRKEGIGVATASPPKAKASARRSAARGSSRRAIASAPSEPRVAAVVAVAGSPLPGRDPQINSSSSARPTAGEIQQRNPTTSAAPSAVRSALRLDDLIRQPPDETWSRQRKDVRMRRARRSPHAPHRSENRSQRRRLSLLSPPRVARLAPDRPRRPAGRLDRASYGVHPTLDPVHAASSGSSSRGAGEPGRPHEPACRSAAAPNNTRRSTCFAWLGAC